MESVFLISLVRLEYTYVSLQIHLEIALYQKNGMMGVCTYLSFVSTRSNHFIPSNPSSCVEIHLNQTKFHIRHQNNLW